MNVAIKVPNDIRGKILSFPFIHKLVKEINKKLDEEESEDVLLLHLISSDNGVDVLNLLPFDAYYHEIEASELKTVFTIHRACMNLNLEKVDLFISTTDSFVDASIGKNLKATVSAGFAGGKNNFLLNKKIPKPTGIHESTKIYQLLKAVVDGELPAIRNVCARAVPPLFDDWNTEPYFVINLSLKGKSIHPEWKELIDLFENKRIILMSDSIEEDLHKSTINEYIKTLSNKNTYDIYEETGHIDFAKLISYSWCFITEDSGLVQVASYCGARVYHMSRKDYSKNFDSRYFLGSHNIYALNDGQFSLKGDFDYGKIFDEIYDFVESKAKER
jgi:ADP-heptose:LPS heptosyltransferase